MELGTHRCRPICLGLWLCRKAGQGRTTGRKAWLLVDRGLWSPGRPLGRYAWALEESGCPGPHVSQGAGFTFLCHTGKPHSLCEPRYCWGP